MLGLTRHDGFSGLIAPSEIFTSETLERFVRHVVDQQLIHSAIGFENEDFIFPGIANIVRFSLVTFSRKGRKEAIFANLLRQPHQIQEKERIISLSKEDIHLLSPISGILPVFRARYDAALSKKVSAKVGVLFDPARKPEANPWGVHSRQGFFNLTSDSSKFLTKDDLDLSHSTDLLPASFFLKGKKIVQIYEGKYVWHYDHRFSSYHNLGKKKGRGGRGLPPTELQEYQDIDFEIEPRYWIDEAYVKTAALNQGWSRDWLIVWRDITNAKVERTVVFSVIPLCGVGNTCQIMFSKEVPRLQTALLANLNSIVLDYFARQFVGGRHLTFGYVQQMPVFPPEYYDAAKLDWIIRRVLELTYTSRSLAPFAHDLGYDDPPFVWDENRRALLCAELDAFYARAYGLTRDELRYVLDPADVRGEDYPSETFRVLKEREIRQHGEYRTRRLVLEAWDRLEANGEFKAMEM